MELTKLIGMMKPDALKQSDWASMFFSENILYLTGIMFPGVNVQCTSSDKIFCNPNLGQSMMLDYVPMTAHGPVHTIIDARDVETHWFITRPEVIKTVMSLQKIDPGPSLENIMTFWGFVAGALRSMVWVMNHEKIIPVSFGALFALGVPADVVVAAQAACIKVCQMENLVGPARLQYMDMCSVSTFATYGLTPSFVSDIPIEKALSIFMKILKMNIRP